MGRLRRRQGWLLALPALAMLTYLTVPFLVLLGGAGRADAAAFTGAATRDALIVSLVAASIATLLDGALGIPLGLWLATTTSRLRHLVTAAVILPLAVPPVVGGLELILLLGRSSPVGRGLDALGISPVDSLAGTILAQMFVAAPFVVITARAAFRGVDPAAVDAARSLGCGPLALFTRVQAPLARGGLAAGLVLGWIRCLGEFGATAVLAYHPYTLPTQTFINLSGEGLRAAIPPGIIAAAVGALAGALALWLESRGSRPQPPAPAAELPSPPPEIAESDLSWMIRQAPGDGLAVDFQVRLDGFELRPRFHGGTGILALIGASGAGKTLTMRVIAGLLAARGTVSVNGSVLLDTDKGISVPAEDRQIGYVAQRDGLFEHLDVRGNIEFGIRHLPAAERERRSAELLRSLDLHRHAQARIRVLSGGERQRVAIARALAPVPRALILDEAFSSLDPEIRGQLRTLVRNVQQRTGLPIVFVTHDREDSLDLADEVVVLAGGRVIQQGPTADVFRSPATAAAARLVGMANLLPVRDLRRTGDGTTASTDWGDFEVAGEVAGPGTIAVAVPADAARLGEGGVPAVVGRIRPGAHQTLVEVVAGGRSRLYCALPSDSEVREGQPVRVTFRQGCYHVVRGGVEPPYGSVREASPRPE